MKVWRWKAQSMPMKAGNGTLLWREGKLSSIACCKLHVRRQPVHVPHPLSLDREVMEIGTVHPYIIVAATPDGRYDILRSRRTVLAQLHYGAGHPWSVYFSLR